MLTPVALLHPRKFLEKLAGRAPFDPAHDLRGRPLRWGRHQNVHMVFADDPTEDLDLQHLARLPHQFTQAQRDIALEHVLAVLRHEDDVVFDPVFRMRSLPVAHAEN